MENDAQMGTAPMVRFERLLPGPIERIWALLTEPGKLPSWFGDGAIEPRAGGVVSLMNGHVRGIVTQWTPPSRLTYTWNVFAPGENRSPYPESYLTLELERSQKLGQQGADVRLTLTHLPVLERFERQNAMGWHTFLDMVEAAAKGSPIEERAAYMKRNAARYGVDLAHLAR